jgi:HEAT repeat protein
MLQHFFLWGGLISLMVGCGPSNTTSQSSSQAQNKEPLFQDKTPSQWIRELQHDSSEVREKAAITIGTMGTMSKLDAPELRFNGFTSEKKKEAVSALVLMLKDKVPSNRGYAAQALTMIGRPEATISVPALKEIQNDEDDFARRLVQEALAELAGKGQ